MGPDPLRELLAAAPFGIALLDASFRCREVNAYLARLDGRDPADHVGLHVRDAVPVFAELIEAHGPHVLAGGQPAEGLRWQSADGAGGSLDWLVSLHPLREGDTFTGVGVVVLDISDSTRTAEQLDRRTTQQAVVARFGQRALAGAALAELSQEAAALAASTLGVEFGEVLELAPDEHVLVLRAGVGWRDGLLGTRITVGAQTQAGTVAVSRAPVVVENLDEEARFAAVGELREHGIVSGASVPIESQGAFLGVLAAHAVKPRRFSTDDVAFLQALANVLGAAMERAAVEAQLRQSAERLHLALEVGRLGAWEWDLATGRVSWSETLETIYGLAPGSFGGSLEDYTDLLHPQDRDRVLRIVQVAVDQGSTLPEFEHRIVRPDGAVRWLHCSGGAVRHPDGQVAGLLGLARDITERKAAEDERARLLQAEHTARTAAEAARERLSFLARITEVLGTTLDVEELLAEVTTRSVGAFADGCAVDLLEGGSLRRAVLDHRDPIKAEAYRELRRLYPPRSGAGNALLRVVETRKPLLIHSISEDFQNAYALDERHLALMRLVDARTAISVPLVARDRVLGLLSFVRDEDRPYDEDALSLAEDVARRLALAIDNALLFAERVEGEGRFRNLATTLQASLLPPHLPDIPGMQLAAAYRPAAKGVEVGGDFYDVFPLERDSWGIVVGDVCGKGPEAATLTAFARYTVRAAAVHHPQPSRAIATLNDAVLRDDRHEPGRFLTLVFVRVRPLPDGAELTLSLGGHPQPLVVRASGDVEAVGEPGSLVGVVPSPGLTDTVVRLWRGDTLLCFTDGVTDVRRGQDVFGEARLAELAAECAGLSPSKLIKRVEQGLDAFGGGISRDDTALLALRVASG